MSQRFLDSPHHLLDQFWGPQDGFFGFSSGGYRERGGHVDVGVDIVVVVIVVFVFLLCWVVVVMLLLLLWCFFYVMIRFFTVFVVVAVL